MSSRTVDRRAVLRGTAVATALAAVGVPLRPGMAGRSPRRGPTQADWNALQATIDGTVVQRGEDGFLAAHQLFDPRYDVRRPLAVVECVSADDVHSAIRFARKQDLACRPKAGGHSYVGVSTMTGGIVIDVSRINQKRYDAGSKIATIGAGSQLYGVHKALAEHGRTIPTGTCPTVGAAGLTLGGGLGVASREHGLTCDQLSGLTLVTASGKVLTVNGDQHPDLFWACRGGGGGNFGIVTSFRFHTQRTRRAGFFFVYFSWADAEKVVRGWSKRVHQMPRSAWANLHLDAASDGSNAVRVVGICRAGDENDQAAAMESAVGANATHVSTFQRSFLDGVEVLGGGTTSSRESFAAGSDILPRMTPDLARTLVHVMARRANSGHSGSAILDPLTGALSDLGAHASAFPWRDHLCDIQWYVGLPPGPSGAEVRAARGWIHRAHRALGGSSDGGYVNYLEPGRGLATYYAGNLTRLRKIKAKYDPDGFFRTPYTIS